MDFLQNFQKIEKKEIYNYNSIKVVDINGNSAIEEPDKVFILPYFVTSRGILFRYENIKAFEIGQKGISHYLTALSANVENNNVLETVKSNLASKFGIKPYLEDKIEITNPIFLTTTQTSKIYFAYVNLYDGQYEEIPVSEFEKLERNDKNAYISINDLENCVIYDLVTKYMLDMFKKSYLVF